MNPYPTFKVEESIFKQVNAFQVDDVTFVFSSKYISSSKEFWKLIFGDIIITITRNGNIFYLDLVGDNARKVLVYLLYKKCTININMGSQTHVAEITIN